MATIWKCTGLKLIRSPKRNKPRPVCVWTSKLLMNDLYDKAEGPVRGEYCDLLYLDPDSPGKGNLGFWSVQNHAGQGELKIPFTSRFTELPRYVFFIEPRICKHTPWISSIRLRRTKNWPQNSETYFCCVKRKTSGNTLPYHFVIYNQIHATAHSLQTADCRSRRR